MRLVAVIAKQLALLDGPKHVQLDLGPVNTLASKKGQQFQFKKKSSTNTAL